MPADIVGIVGYGEVGRSLAEGFIEKGLKVIAYDSLWSKSSATVKPGIVVAADAAAVASAARTIIVAVPASAVEEAVASCASGLRDDALLVELSAATPETKVRAADLLGARRDAYIDVALSSPPLQDGIAARMYASGSRAQQFFSWGETYGMNVIVFGNAVGDCARLKIVRGILAKGLEAILLECMTTAQRAGLDPRSVLRSLSGAFDQRPFEEMCAHLIATDVLHAPRRAVELSEAVKLERQLGLRPEMAEAAERVLRLAASLTLSSDKPNFDDSVARYARHASPTIALSN